MTKRNYTISNIILVLIGIVLILEIIRDCQRPGDFIGYVNAGNLVLSNTDIYSDYLNTWPPFFSVFCVFLAWGDSLSTVGIRLLWLVGSFVSMYYIVIWTVRLFFEKEISWNKKGEGIQIQDTIIVIPLLIMLRYIMDNFANVQINIYMLLCAILFMYFFVKEKYILSGFLLAITISLKVYTIFFLFYFIYKRAFKPVIWTLLFLIIINAISFIVFGFEQAFEYYVHWANEVAPKSYLANHKNQSLFGAFLRFFTTEDVSNNLHVNFLSLEPKMAKMLTYVAVVIASIIPAILFRKKIIKPNSLNSLIEYSFIFTAIPILSPVSWKAYFIFLWVPYFLLFTLFYKTENQLKESTLKILRGTFWLSVILVVGSTELIVGNHFSDVLEAYSVITFGSILLLMIQVYIKIRIESFDFDKISII